MTILRDISTLWGTSHSLVLFLILFESRYPKKKTLTLTLSIMGPLMLVNFIMLFLLGPERMGTLIMLTCSLPSLIFFWILAKHRGGRFLFTFCLSDTLVLELLYITSILDFYLGNTYIFMFIARLLVYPVLEIFVYKYVRPIYLDVQNKIEKGWLTFSAIGFVFYIVMLLSMSYPTIITERLEYLPAFALLLFLMPVLYIHIFSTLRHQQQSYEIMEKEHLLQMQVSNMQSRMEEFNTADNKFRMERHNFRHKLQTIAVLIDKQHYNELSLLVQEYSEAIRETQVKRYCNHAIIDAALSSYLQMAERKNISITTKMAFPDTLPVSEAELATVLANAIENAIHACEKIEESKRHLDIQVRTAPGFMLQIRNSFNGSIVFDENNIPTNAEEGHGFGTRSIVAFCEKNHAFCEFKADGDTFYLRIVFE